MTIKQGEYFYTPMKCTKCYHKKPLVEWRVKLSDGNSEGVTQNDEDWYCLKCIKQEFPGIKED